MDKDELIKELGCRCALLMGEYADKLSEFEIGNQFIRTGTSMLLYCSGDELSGVKSILTSVRSGIVMYEEDHS